MIPNKESARNFTIFIVDLSSTLSQDASHSLPQCFYTSANDTCIHLYNAKEKCFISFEYDYMIFFHMVFIKSHRSEVRDCLIILIVYRLFFFFFFPLMIVLDGQSGNTCLRNNPGKSQFLRSLQHRFGIYYSSSQSIKQKCCK